MPLLGIIEIVIQVYFAVHAGKTGRYGWIFIILFFPLVGSLIYFFVEYLPEMRVESRVKTRRNVSANKRVAELQREMEITDSIKNRINLAEAYFQNGMYQESINLLEKSLVGTYTNDPYILKGLCHAYFKNGNYEKTKEYLSMYEKNTEGKLVNNIRLMKAKTCEALGQDREALEEYKAIVNLYDGEEARCCYALLLKKNGEKHEAKKLFEEILKNAKLYPKQYKKFQSEWVAIADAEITD
jgi:hypothetical protein